MKRILAALTALFVLVLTACSSIDSGTVTDKHHRDGYYYTQMICASYNAQGLCTVHVPIQHYQPPTWRLDLREGEEEGWVYVSEGTYAATEIGDRYVTPQEVQSRGR